MSIACISAIYQIQTKDDFVAVRGVSLCSSGIDRNRFRCILRHVIVIVAQKMPLPLPCGRIGHKELLVCCTSTFGISSKHHEIWWSSHLQPDLKPHFSSIWSSKAQVRSFIALRRLSWLRYDYQNTIESGYVTVYCQVYGFTFASVDGWDEVLVTANAFTSLFLLHFNERNPYDS